jgi:aryl-alcohol dehydrogenase-like predicted oxidoreductase
VRLARAAITYIPATHTVSHKILGYEIPCLGFGVALISNGAPVLEAVRAGYRHFDSAQHYNNEAAVGQALRESGVPRAEIFISERRAAIFMSWGMSWGLKMTFSDEGAPWNGELRVRRGEH